MKLFLFALLLAPLFGHSAHASSNCEDRGLTELSFAKGSILACAGWVQGPRSPQESVLRIEWQNADGLPQDPTGSFKVTLWMPSMGHGSAPTQIQRALNEAGEPIAAVYDVRNMYFTMGGQWEVRVGLKFPNGATETQAFAVEIAGGGGHHH